MAWSSLEVVSQPAVLGLHSEAQARDLLLSGQVKRQMSQQEEVFGDCPRLNAAPIRPKSLVQDRVYLVCDSPVTPKDLAKSDPLDLTTHAK